MMKILQSKGLKNIITGEQNDAENVLMELLDAIHVGDASVTAIVSNSSAFCLSIV